jgi:ABC-type sugar transport system ATPase subunit
VKRNRYSSIKNVFHTQYNWGKGDICQTVSRKTPLKNHKLRPSRPDTALNPSEISRSQKERRLFAAPPPAKFLARPQVATDPMLVDKTTEKASSDILLEARDVSKGFPGVQALDKVSLTIRRGKLTALLGENGAGKSTLMNILAGVFLPDSGSIEFEHRPVRFQNTRDARNAGIAIIFQELNLIPQLSIAENIFLGREPLTRFGMINYPKINRDAKELLIELECDLDPEISIQQLRVGQQQVVEIAKALSLQAKVIIMDEPTSAITEQEIEILFRVIKRLKASGTGIVYITHKLEELFEIADDVTVFRDGQFVGTNPLASLQRSKMIQMMVGRNLSELYPKSEPTKMPEKLRVDSITLRSTGPIPSRLIDNVSFSVHGGEVLGIFGLMGAGRTELLETVFGLHSGHSDGTITIEGKPKKIRSPQDAIKAGIALAPEDRKGHGLVMKMSVGKNSSLSSLSQCETAGFISRTKEESLVASFIQRLRIKTPTQHELIRNLSGGNQQKVVLAKWMATNPKILLLDEPTRGIDINAKKEIYRLIDELTQAGLAVVLVSSELPEVLAISDRIMVLCEGKKTGEFTRAEATEEGIIEAALPH